MLERNNPREFWRYFKSAGNRVSDSLSLDDFKHFVANLSDGLFNCEHDEAEEFCCTHNFNTDNCSFPELDLCITNHRQIPSRTYSPVMFDTQDIFPPVVFLPRTYSIPSFLTPRTYFLQSFFYPGHIPSRHFPTPDIFPPVVFPPKTYFLP